MVDFLGVNIGNVNLTYKIEADGKNVPTLTMSATRSGDYLVLNSAPVTNTSISSTTVINGIEENGGPDDFVNGENKTSVLNGNTEVGACACIGYMLIKITWMKMVDQKVAPTGGASTNTAWKTVKVAQPVTDYIVTTAYNVARESSKNAYTVHNNSSKGGQTHVEQICAYRLRAFLDHLRTVRTAQNALAFDMTQFTAEGDVRFRGKDKSGGALTLPCNGCKGVWTPLQQEYRFLKPITLRPD